MGLRRTSSSRRRAPRGRDVGLSLLLALSGAVSGCSGPEPLRIVLVTIDTLRPDHLSAYGYARAPDADLAWLAEQGVVFRDASSTTSWTAPALASLMTSLHPHQHRVRHGAATKFLQGDLEVAMQEVLPDEVTTLAERLAAAGFDTVGVSTSPHTSESLGFAQGFAHYESLAARDPDPRAGRVYADGAAVRERLEALLPRLRQSRRLFLWIHLLDPHHPYVAREPFAADYRAESGGGRGPRLVARPRPRLAPGAAVERERRKLVDLYDSEVAFAIRELALLLDALELGDEAMIVLTSDHGEAFYEHGYWGHSAYLFEEELRVPLVIRFPARLGLRGVVDAPVSLVDVAPTILEVAGVAGDGASVGRSLLPLAGGASEPPRPAFAELVRHGHQVHAVRRGRFKLIVDAQRGVEELFDLERDPGETTNLAARPGPEADAALPLLRALLREQLAAAEAAAEGERQPVSAEETEALRALGYLE